MKKKYIFAAVLAALIIFALLRLDGENLLYSIRQVPTWIVILLLALQIVTQLLINLQWYILAKMADIPILYRDMFYANSQGAVLDSITPGVKFGGEITRAMQISKISKCTGEQAAALVAVQKIFSISAMVFVMLVVVGGAFVEISSGVLGEVSHFSIGYLLLFVFAMFILLMFSAVLFMPHRINLYLQAKPPPRFLWMTKVRGFLITLIRQVEIIRKSKAKRVMLVGLSLLIWALYPLKMYVVVVQFYAGVGVLQAGAIAFAAYLVAMIPVFPGGLGGFEGAMTGLLAAVGVLVSDAVVVAVFFRFVTFWFVFLMGLGYNLLYHASD